MATSVEAVECSSTDEQHRCNHETIQNAFVKGLHLAEFAMQDE